MARMLIDPTHTNERAARTRLRLRALAHDQHITIAELARRSGLTRDLVERYWKNRTKMVHLEALALLAQALNVQTGDLITDAPEEAEPH